MAVADDITAGEVSLIEGLGLSGVTVRDWKQAATTELNTPTLITVSVDDDRTEYETADDDTGVAGFYTVRVTIARRNSGDGLSGASTMRTMRQSIRRKTVAVDGLASAVVAVDWVDALPTPQFDAGLLDGGWDYGFLNFRVKTREARTP